MDKRVLVTGGSGFVGRHSLARLAARGYEVHAVYSQGLPDGTAEWHQADLTNPDQVTDLIAKVQPNHLLHFAWYAEHGKYWQSPLNLAWVEASLFLLRKFTEAGGLRAVLAGTCAEYDWRFGFCSETVTPTEASTLYGVSKNAVRSVAQRYAATNDLSLAWGRIFFVHGPSEDERRLVPSVVRSLQRGAPVRCSHGRQFRDFLHVEDCASGFVALLESGVEGPVNIASGQAVTLGLVVQTIKELFPGGDTIPIEFGAFPSPPDDPPLLVADIRRLTSEVGWIPQFGLRAGLARTLESMGVQIRTENLV